MSSNSTNIINPKPCIYNCGTRIFWDTSSNSYLEIFTKQRHVCKNRIANNNMSYPKSNVPKTNYYYNKFSKQHKPKMSNNLELITGPIDSVQKKYEILSDIILDLGGKTHGSQSQISGNDISLIVYYEVPEGKREEVKSRFKNSIIILCSSKEN
ncbi:MAG TPA: hypothetical protein VFK40_07740 [Nitrososphaeraceae archaeon]|nr:hypothetical protein [Nitrososphaeraceae archaeon]